MEKYMSYVTVKTKVYSQEGPHPPGADRVGNQRPGKEVERTNWDVRGNLRDICDCLLVLLLTSYVINMWF